MASTNVQGAVVLVEGPSDEAFFTRRLSSTTYIVQAGGRTNVEGAVTYLNLGSVAKVAPYLGIVDEDNDWLFPAKVVPENVVKFDPRDLEGLLIRSTALEGVLVEYGDAGKVRTFEAANRVSVRDALASRTELFGRLHAYNALNNKVCLKKLKPQRFCDVASWSYDEASVIDEAVRLGVHDDSGGLADEITRLPMPSIWHLARGHDLIDVLVGGLLSVLGGHRRVSHDAVASLLRQGCHPAAFSASGLYASIEIWQERVGIGVLAA